MSILQPDNGFLSSVANTLGENYLNADYELTQLDVSKIEAEYDRDYGTPDPIGSENIFGEIMTPKDYMNQASEFYNQCMSAQVFFEALGFVFAPKDSTI